MARWATWHSPEEISGSVDEDVTKREIRLLLVKVKEDEGGKGGAQEEGRKEGQCWVRQTANEG